jgi:hypothetical protein
MALLSIVFLKKATPAHSNSSLSSPVDNSKVPPSDLIDSDSDGSRALRRRSLAHDDDLSSCRRSSSPPKRPPLLRWAATEDSEIRRNERYSVRSADPTLVLLSISEPTVLLDGLLLAITHSTPCVFVFINLERSYSMRRAMLLRLWLQQRDTWAQRCRRILLTCDAAILRRVVQTNK